jgi:ketosteroid isomerase-like protein
VLLRPLLLLLLTTLAIQAHGQAPCPAPIADSLLAADRRFAADAQKDGLPGWLRHFAEDAQGLAPDDREIRGKSAITQYYTQAFANPAAIPRWTPMRADCASDGSLGFTYGTWRSQAAEGPVGQYVTVWRKQSDASWKVVFDLGNLRQPPL